MCELGVFPIFLDNHLSKIATILRLSILRKEKTSKDLKPDGLCFPIAVAVKFLLNGLFTSPFIRVE